MWARSAPIQTPPFSRASVICETPKHKNLAITPDAFDLKPGYLNAKPIFCFGKTLKERRHRSSQGPVGGLQEPAALVFAVYLVIQAHQHSNQFTVRESKTPFRILVARPDVDRLQGNRHSPIASFVPRVTPVTKWTAVCLCSYRLG